MKDPEISAELVERLLGVRVKQVEYPELEKAIEPRYTFQNTCAENNSVNLDDKCVKIVYNASAYKSVEEPKIRALLRFIQTDESGEDDFSRRLCEFVDKVKENEKFRKEFAEMNLHDYDIMTEAKEEGIQEKAVETARNMLKKNYPTSDIAEITGLPLDQVLELQKELATAPAN